MSNATLFEIGGFEVNSVMTTSLAITAVLSVVAIAGTRNMKERQPGRLQSALEYAVGSLERCLCLSSFPIIAVCCRLPENCRAFSPQRAR